jgi:micrococcal nuclease
MAFVRGVVLFMVALAVDLAAQAPSASGLCSLAALVTHVFDGDTVYVAGVGRVRLLGIDAPEVGSGFERPAPFAVEARERLQALVLQHWVRLECDSPRRDGYGRQLAYIFRGGREFINAQLVREGLARVSARTRLRYWDELRQAEDEAQARRRGMWGDRPRVPSPTYTLPPRPRSSN